MKNLLTLFLLSCCCFFSLQAHSPDEYKYASLLETVQLTVFPNPSSTGKFSVAVEDLRPRAVLEVRVFNLIGGEIYSTTLVATSGKETLEISLASAPTGIYMLEISLGDEKITRRISFI
jgi:hypothetical protein